MNQQIQKQNKPKLHIYLGKDFTIYTFYLPYGGVLGGGNARFDYEGKETDETDLQYFEVYA